jgi:hypothetical protein
LNEDSSASNQAEQRRSYSEPGANSEPVKHCAILRGYYVKEVVHVNLLSLNKIA